MPSNFFDDLVGIKITSVLDELDVNTNTLDIFKKRDMFDEITNNVNSDVIITTKLSNFTISNKTFGAAPFTITPPTSNSNGSFAYTILDNTIGTINGNVLTILKSGTTSITATQVATSYYTSASITTTFVVGKATPILRTFTIPNKTFGEMPFAIIPPQ